MKKVYGCHGPQKVAGVNRFNSPSASLSCWFIFLVWDGMDNNCGSQRHPPDGSVWLTTVGQTGKLSCARFHPRIDPFRAEEWIETGANKRIQSCTPSNRDWKHRCGAAGVDVNDGVPCELHIAKHTQYGIQASPESTIHIHRSYKEYFQRGKKRYLLLALLWVQRRPCAKWMLGCHSGSSVGNNAILTSSCQGMKGLQ